MEGVLALIPAYEEGPRIAAVVARTRAHLPVVVVDDGSSDDTAAQAEAAGATVLRQTPNAGKGAALRAGFRHALERGAPAVVTLDADGQHDPDEIPRFLAAHEARGLGGARDTGDTHDAPGARDARPEPPELVVGSRDFADMPRSVVSPVRSTRGSSRPSWDVASPTTSRATGSSAVASWASSSTATSRASSSRSR